MLHLCIKRKRKIPTRNSDDTLMLYLNKIKQMKKAWVQTFRSKIVG